MDQNIYNLGKLVGAITTATEGLDEQDRYYVQVAHDSCSAKPMIGHALLTEVWRGMQDRVPLELRARVDQMIYRARTLTLPVRSDDEIAFGNGFVDGLREMAA